MPSTREAEARGHRNAEELKIAPPQSLIRDSQSAREAEACAPPAEGRGASKHSSGGGVGGGQLAWRQGRRRRLMNMEFLTQNYIPE